MAKVKDCPFCNPKNVGYRTVKNGVMCFAIHQEKYEVSKGHTLIIPRRHVSSYFDLTAGEIAEMHELSYKIKRDLEAKHSDIDGWNIGFNVGEAAGQTVFHVHMHLIPRRFGDVENPRGGVRGVIPEKQNY